jgi:four helix bundle suffix protein
MANEIYNGKPYRELMSYKRAKTIYLATYTFAERFLEKSDRTYDQMIQAARSGKQNIVEGAKASAGSKESELFLTNVASASLEELLEDYLDFLETRKLEIWDKESEKVRYVRNLCRRDNGSYEHYREFIESRSAEVVANIVITLIHQASYLLERQISALEKKLLAEGGVKEQITKRWLEARNKVKFQQNS